MPVPLSPKYYHPWPQPLAFAGLRHKAVRDLAWAILSADLVNPSIAGDMSATNNIRDNPDQGATASGPENLKPENLKLENLTPESLTATPVATAAAPLNEQQSLKHWQWLHQLDQQPQALWALLDQCETRFLGSYFEALWEFYIRHYGDYEFITRNLAVRQPLTAAPAKRAQRRSAKAQHTLGEFDLLYRQPASDPQSVQQTVHAELAVKFYLGVPAQRPSQAGPNQPVTDPKYSAAQQWWGPNGIDRLDLKLNKMRHQQLRLGQLAASTAPLAELGIDKAPRTRLVLKGYLFYPAGPGVEHLAPPHEALNTHLRGHWYRANELPTNFDETLGFRVLPKNQWLAPLCIEHDGLGHEGLNKVQLPLPWPELTRQLSQYFGAGDSPSLGSKALAEGSLTKQAEGSLSAEGSTPLGLKALAEGSLFKTTEGSIIRPLLIAALRPQRLQGRSIWLEEQRFFVVPADWQVPLDAASDSG